MSWEANSWATKQRMKLPQEQLVLLVLGNCADPDGVAFSKWPGRDHWWKYLAKLTRLSKSSLFRHINTLVALGLATRTMLVLADGARRPTISLDLTASFDIEREENRYLAAVHSRRWEQSYGETGVDDDAEEAENASASKVLDAENKGATDQSHHETVPTGGNDPVPPAGMHIESILDSNISPLPPSGGLSVRDELWDQFVKAWGEPIPKMALARSAWDHVETARRPEGIAAARGYWAWLKAHPKPPAAQSAQSFIRDAVGWAQWLCYTPSGDGAPVAVSGAFALASAEGKAICRLHEIAGLDQFLRGVMIRNGLVNYARPLSPRLLALADAPRNRDEWVVLTHQQAAAWEGLLRDTITVLMRNRLREGSRAPWPFPPSSTGKIYTTGPPETLMTEQDMADFR